MVQHLWTSKIWESSTRTQKSQSGLTWSCFLSFQVLLRCMLSYVVARNLRSCIHNEAVVIEAPKWRSQSHCAMVPWCYGPGHVYSACSALCSQRLGWVTQNTQVAETDLSFQIDSNSHSPCKIPVVTATRTGLNLPQWNPRTVPSNAVHRPVWDPICDHLCLCVVPGGLSLISLIPILLQGRIRICKLSHNRYYMNLYDIIGTV